MKNSLAILLIVLFFGACNASTRNNEELPTPIITIDSSEFNGRLYVYTYDFFNNQLITEEPQINWTPKGLEFYLLYYCRNYDNPNVNNVKYNLFLKYWIKYILIKYQYPHTSIEKLIFSDYLYITARLPHSKKVSYNLYSASEIINQNFENLDSIKSSSLD
jgi:hypothetical protein